MSNEDQTKHLTTGQLIRQARMVTGQSQRELAESLGFSRSYLSKLENDRRNPSFKFAARMRKKYHLDLLFLDPETDRQ